MSDTLVELSGFVYDEAWRLGSAVVERCPPRLGRDDNYAAWRTTGLPRSSARHESDNDSWADRKARVVARFGLSSLEVFERHVRDNPDFFSLFALSPQDDAPFGGAIPVHVRGALVGEVTVAGVDDQRRAASRTGPPLPRPPSGWSPR